MKGSVLFVAVAGAVAVVPLAAAAQKPNEAAAPDPATPVIVLEEEAPSRAPLTIVEEPAAVSDTSETEVTDVRARPGPPPTYFIAESYAGAAVVGGFGGHLSLRVGVGGKLPSMPWRFYLIAETAYTSAATDGELASTGQSFEEGRSWIDVALGGRIYVPIAGPVRIFLDALGGGSWGTAWLERPGSRTLDPSEWTPLAIVGTGVQVRMLHGLSVGGRIAFRFAGDPLSELRDELGIDTLPPLVVSAGLTWHF